MVYLRGVRPKLLKDSEKESLRGLLEKMGCGDLIDKAWIFKSLALVSEIFGKKVLFWFDKTMRGKPGLQNADLWAEAYGMTESGEGWAS